MVKLKTFVAIQCLLFLLLLACSQKTGSDTSSLPQTKEEPQVIGVLPKPGAERLGEYLPILKGKKIAAVVNHTSTVGGTHLVDTFLKSGVNLVKIFAPEHGFRGTASDGEQIKDGKDQKTGLPIISLYGKEKKPSPSNLRGIDLLVFDIQDVGVRFYTFISTLSYVLEACAEQSIPVLVLDRPNPNGHYVDGQVLKKEFASFVGLHEVPVVYGMTIGEYARMVNGEGWLSNSIKCQLEVIPCQNYDHKTKYEVPIKPSPNLPNMRAILLYPSLCFFEGTVVSVGRGTDKQFQVIGAPNASVGDFKFMPQPMEGALNPPQKGKECRGHDLCSLSVDSLFKIKRINLAYLLDFYSSYPDKKHFFLETAHFDALAGSKELKQQIIAGKPEPEIRAGWEAGVKRFKEVRKKYLLYYDFE
ncbi:MAG: DUF1343 domain-containing protein [Saprospiraceae bacterium]|nr:DUF1343 domain-containing protein [Saprospiraceae bacterium]